MLDQVVRAHVMRKTQRKRDARQRMPPIAGQGTRCSEQPESGLCPLNIVKQWRRSPLLSRPPRDRGRLQHRTDGTVDMLNIPKRFQHAQIVAKIADPGHQRFTTFKLAAFAPDTPVHRLAVGDSISNWSKIRVTM